MSEVFRKHIPTVESLIAEGIEPKVAQQIIDMHYTGDLPEASEHDSKGPYPYDQSVIVFSDGSRIQVTRGK